MTDFTIRIYEQSRDGEWIDRQDDYDIASFGGVIPSVGDMILDPGVLQGLDRRDPGNRRMWTVVQRVFNPRDLRDYVALIVEEHVPRGREAAMV